MTIRNRRIFAALIDAFIVSVLEVGVLLLIGHETLDQLFHQHLNVQTDLGSIHLSGGSFLMMADWAVISFLDGLLVFVQPLALASLFQVSQLSTQPQTQIWLISGLSLLVNAAYRIPFEYSPLRASIGMRIFRLRVAYDGFTLRKNPVVRHLAKIATMPVIIMANFVGLPFAFVFAKSEDSDLGFYIRKLAGADPDELLHDEIAEVTLETF